MTIKLILLELGLIPMAAVLSVFGFYHLGRIPPGSTVELIKFIVFTGLIVGVIANTAIILLFRYGYFNLGNAWVVLLSWVLANFIASAFSIWYYVGEVPGKGTLAAIPLTVIAIILASVWK